MKAVQGAVDRGLPLRLSARKGDAHYCEQAAGLSDRIDILLDGEVLDTATSYDVVAGEVVRHRRHDDGTLILEKGAPTFETLRGRVEVRWLRNGGGE
jgi:hypothetical protein